jgi:hypothetical protein
VRLAWAVAAAAAVVATFGDAAPTGIGVVDAAYRGLFVFGVALACAFARRWTWPVVAAAALFALPGLPWLAVGGAGLAIAAGSQLDRRRRQHVGALVGALAGLTLLHLPPFVAFGVPSVIAAIAPLPAVGSSLVNLRRQVRRPVLTGAVVVGVMCLLLAVASTVMAFGLRADADRGVDAARAGLQAARAGDEAEAVDAFRQAGASFEQAADGAAAWWLAPGRLVPVLSQHLELAGEMSAAGAELADVSSRTAPAVALEGLTTTDGTFRLDRITELRTMAADVAAALERTDQRLGGLATPWLIGPAEAALTSFRAELAEAGPDAELALTALDVARGLLGADGPKRYVVLFGNPAEARAMGGFVGSIGLLQADGGRLAYGTVEGSGQLSQALAEVGAALDPALDVPASLRNAQPQRFVQNWTGDVDIANLTQVVVDLAPQIEALGPIDGVLYADPRVMAALLELTGPITIPGTEQELDASTATEFLQRGQYRTDDGTLEADRKDRLGDAAEIAFDRLLARTQPEPRRLVDVLGPLVRARRLLFATTDPEANELLTTVGLRAPVRAIRGETVLVSHHNRRANKLDAYLERSISYDAAVDDDGAVRATMTVSLTNTADVGDLSTYQLGQVRDSEAPGTNHLTLDLRSALEIVDVTVDGRPAQRSDLVRNGLAQSSVPVSVPPGASVVVQAVLRGHVDPASCAFEFLPNGGANVDELAVRLDLPGTGHRLGEQPLVQTLSLPCDAQ